MSLRADARRNRELILKAGHELFLELGATAPLDQIAERAGVGNATLYRRFPTREELIKQVAIDNMNQVRDQARAALGEPDAWTGFVRFCHAVVERRIVALLPILGPGLPQDADVIEAEDGLGEAMSALIEAARRQGTLRADVEFGDLVMILATITRPLPAVRQRLTVAVQARHLGLVLDGLRGSTPLPGTPIQRDDITASLR